jgi:hypothetical protein
MYIACIKTHCDLCVHGECYVVALAHHWHTHTHTSSSQAATISDEAEIANEVESEIEHLDKCIPLSLRRVECFAPQFEIRSESIIRHVRL